LFNDSTMEVNVGTWKDSVRVATASHIPDLTAVTLIDGVSVGTGDRILVKDQTNPIRNGIYEARANAQGRFRLTRADDMRRGLATPDTSQATVRVSAGNQNAGTQWRLRAPGAIKVGTTSLPWIHENRNYSVESIAALKALVGAPIGSTASVAGYATAGDNGGGAFSFVRVPKSSRVTRAELISITIIDRKSSPAGVAFTTDREHGFDVGQSVYLSDVGSATGARIITGKSPTTFSVQEITTAALGANAHASCVKLEMEENHGRPPGSQRVAVSGVVGSTEANGPQPPNLSKIWDRSGVSGSDPKTLTLPVELPVLGLERWRYTPGPAAVVGDDALLVTATDAKGNGGGLWKRTITTPFHVAWWGALGDPDTHIDDGPAINAAINAAKRFRDYDPSRRRHSGSTVRLGPGVYSCASKILIDGAVSLEGVSPGFGSGAAMLVFPLNMGDGDALVDIVNTSTDGSGTSGVGARICDLQVVQDPASWPADAVTFPSSVANFNERVRTVGIRVRASAVTLEDIFVHDIQGRGIFIDGDGKGVNANFWCIRGHVSVHRCLESGVLVQGETANQGAQSGTLDVMACGAWGVHEHSQHGNSWGTVHTAGNGFQVAVPNDPPGAPPDWLYNGFAVPRELIWSPGKPIRLGQRVLPTFSADPDKDRRTGFTYRATKVDRAGKTGETEPLGPTMSGPPEEKWPTKLGKTVRDGAIEWTCWSHEGGALYHEGGANWSTYENIYVEGEQPCRFDNNTASVKQVMQMHPSSQVVTANAGTSHHGTHPVPFAVWTRRSESWDEGHLLGTSRHPVIVGVGEHHGEAVGEPPRKGSDWAVATFKRADQDNRWRWKAPGIVAPDVPGRWTHDVGALRDRWDGVHGRQTVHGVALPPASLRWQVEWDIEGTGDRASAHPFHSYSQVGGRSLPQPGAMCFPSLWLGNKTGVERRLGAVPARGDGSQLPDLTELDQSGGNAFEQGDILFNAPKEGRPAWPAAWRAKRRTAVMTRMDVFDLQVPGTTRWFERLYFYAGYVFRARDGSLWRARNSGFSADGPGDETTRPHFETNSRPGPPLRDGDISWEFWSFDDPTAWEPLISQAPTLVDVDVSAGGTITLTSEQAAHAVLRFTGDIRSNVEVIVEPGPSEFWTKTFVNATTGGYGLRVRATDSGSGVRIQQASAASLITSGTDVELLSSPNARGAPSVSVDTSISSATTSDEAPVTTTLFELVDPEVRRIDIVITVTNDTRETRGAWSIVALAALVGATASLDGGGRDPNAIKTDGGLDAEVIVSGTSVQLKCTGLADSDLTWGWEVRGQQQESAAT
jgi:hypothetical protein